MENERDKVYFYEKSSNKIVFIRYEGLKELFRYNNYKFLANSIEYIKTNRIASERGFYLLLRRGR